jgi:hypothetical protein
VNAVTDAGHASRRRANLITAAQPSYEDQFRSRRRRYVIMMGMRVPFLIAAVAVYHTPWLAILLILLSVPLPWCAVLIANDRPARKRAMAGRGVLNNQREIPGGPREIVDSQPEDETHPSR